MSEIEWKYGEARIVLSTTKQFVVFYGDEDEGKSYDAYAQACAAIDAQVEREARANQVKISVPVISAKKDFEKKHVIKTHVITGIHGGHGGYIARPPLEKYSSGTLYLDHPNVKTLLEAHLQAEERAEEESKQREEELRPFQLSTSDWERKGILDTASGVEKWRVKTVAAADALNKVDPRI